MKDHRSTSGRLQRIAAQMQRVLAELVARELKDPRVGRVTITQVVLSPDLSNAEVYVAKRLDSSYYIRVRSPAGQAIN